MATGGRDGWERLFRSVFEGSRNPMALIDARRRVVEEVNARFAELLGAAPADIEGRGVDELVDMAHVRGPRLTWERLTETADYHGETAVIGADGTPLRLQFAARGAAVDGRRLVLLVVADQEHDDAEAPHAPEAAGDGVLTPREREVLRMVALGLNSREIARELHVSIDTVRRHVSNAMARVGARTRAQLVAIALSEGLIE